MAIGLQLLGEGGGDSSTVFEYDRWLRWNQAQSSIAGLQLECSWGAAGRIGVSLAD